MKVVGYPILIEKYSSKKFRFIFEKITLVKRYKYDQI